MSRMTFEDAIAELHTAQSKLLVKGVSASEIVDAVGRSAVIRNALVLELLASSDVDDSHARLIRDRDDLVLQDRSLVRTAEALSGYLHDLQIDLIKITSALTEENGRRSADLSDVMLALNAAKEELARTKARLREHAQHSSEVRETVWNMTGGKCFHCEVELIRNGEAEQATDRSRVFHVDHLVPKSVGGPDHLSNYVPACERCNISKGAKSYVEFRAVRAAQQQPVQLTVIEGGAALQGVVG